jgi:GT2 family glycosyltransferase
VTTMPLVSVVIPTRDRWELLARMGLAAALVQEAVDLEVVLVDDGSSAPPPQGLPGLDDPRVRVVRHPTSRGVPAARNTGIAEARGTWLAFLDDDDAWSPHKLEKQLERARASSARFVYSGVVSVDGSGRVLHGYPVPAPESVALELLARCVIPAGSSNVLVEAELVRSLGGFDEGLPHLCDWDLWIRLARAAQAAAVPEVLVAYVEQHEAMSLVLPRSAFDELACLERKHRALHAEHGVGVDRVAYAHNAAWLQLRRRRHASAAAVYLRSAFSNRRPQDLGPAARFAVRALLPVRRSLKDTAPPPAPSAPVWLERYRFA